MKIAFYVSDHGYGHATRSIALVRALAAEGGPDLRLEVVNHHAHGLLRRALEGLKGVTVLDRTTDVGFTCSEERLCFDRGRTALAVSSWIGGWRGFVASEVERLRRAPPDLIVSDVPPQPLLVAEKLGIPSVVTSNFTWVDQYEPHLRPDLVAPLRGAYALAARGHAYPMRTALSGVRNLVAAGLVTREPSRDPAEVRRSLGVEPGVPLVHLGFGWSADAVAAARELDTSYLPGEVRLLVSSNLAAVASSDDLSRRIVPIPDEETEAHEAIAACDLVIAKAGYSTVAEAIAGRVPVLAIPVEGSIESGTIARSVERLGIGSSAPANEPLDGRVLARAADMLDSLERYHEAYRRLPAEFGPGAAARLAHLLLTDIPG